MRSCDPGTTPMYYRFANAPDEASDNALLVLEILADGSMRQVLGDAGASDEDLHALGQVSHLDGLVTGLGQRLRHYVQCALQSDNTLRFRWSQWDRVPPVYHEITVDPNDELSAVTVSVSDAHSLQRPDSEGAWCLQALRQINDGVIVAEAEQGLGGEARITYVNPGFTAISGFQPDDLFGKNAKSLFEPDDGQHGAIRLRALVGHSGVGERILSCKDGTKRPVELDIRSVSDEAGWLVQWIIVVRAGKSARTGERRVRLLDDALRAARTGVIVTDAAAQDDGPHIVYANPEFCRLTGYSASELNGRSAFFLLGSQPEKPMVAALRHAIEEGVVDHRTTRCYRKDGSECWLRWHSVSPVYDEKQQVKNFLALVQDVTSEWTDTEKQVRDSRRESVGLIAAGTAHALNNVLTFICSNALLAKEDPTAETVSGCLRQIEEAVMSASKLTRQLLNFARAETSVEIAVALPKLLRETVKFSLHGSPVRSKFQIDESCPPVLADDTGLRQAISNLVLNACDAMPTGGICHVKLARITLAPGVLACLLPGNYAQITVSDTGGGITPEDLPRVFDPGYTTKKSRNGLGLTAARAIVQKYGGHLEVESAVGQGTTAVIYLPVYAGGVDEAPSTHNEVIQGSGRVLLMEDDPRLGEGLERAVRMLGYCPFLTQDGAQAVELYASAQEAGDPFDLVVLDLTVPGGMGAKATLPKLRELNPNVRVVIGSGYNEADILASVSETGFDAVLPKPYTAAELSRVLAYAIGSGPDAERVTGNA